MPDNADSWHASSVADQTMTRRKAEVAGLVSQASRIKLSRNPLEIGEGTVKSHLHNIHQKLHDSDRIGHTDRDPKSPEKNP